MLHPSRVITALLVLTVSAYAFCGQPSSISRQVVSAPAAKCLYMAAAPKNDEHEPLPSMRRKNKLWKKSKTTIASLALALSMFRGVAPASAAAVLTKESTDISARANDVLIESLRPGATNEDAQQALDVEVLVREKTEVNTVAKKTADETAAAKQKKTKNQKKNLYYDDDEEGEDDDEFFDNDEKKQLEQAASSKSAMKTTTTSELFVKKGEIGTSTYVKAVAIFITAPVLLFSGIETYKRRSESAYVKKALKIQAMKKEEYLSKTAAEEKAKLELEGNSTKVDDDDDDDDDDEDDDEDDDDEPAAASPKKPKGGDDGGGDDAPSADDIERLNKLMGKK